MDPNREQELRDALKKDASGGSMITFLDTVNSVEELEGLSPILAGAGKAEIVGYYRDCLTKWSDPRLPTGFEVSCPLLAKRLDTPQKIRIFLRGADFRHVEPMLMGKVLEDILRRHEVGGEQLVSYKRYRGDKHGDALRIVYHTQLQAWTLTDLVLPGARKGASTDIGLFIDWRTKEERNAAGDYW